jgi:hypothetical protein
MNSAIFSLTPSSITLLPMMTSIAPLLNLSLRFWRAALLLATFAAALFFCGAVAGHLITCR